MKKITINIYVDMDGVLANFSKEINAVKRFETEKDFFYKLKPIKNNVETIKELINNNFNVYILSASPNQRCDTDKIKWLNKYIPNLNINNIIIMRNGENKADYVKTQNNNILFDDYGKNINDFINRGYKGYQVKKYHTIRKGIIQLLNE